MCFIYSTGAIQYTDESALQDILTSNKETLAHFATAALHIMPPNDTTDDVVLHNARLISVIATGVLVLIGTISLVVVIVVYCRKRQAK